MKEAYPSEFKKTTSLDQLHINYMRSVDEKCAKCSQQHPFWKCKDYKSMKPSQKFDLVKKLELCANCFKQGHKRDECTSENTCFKKECGQKHHTSLHDYFLKREEARKAAREKRNERRNQDNQNNEEEEDEVAAVMCTRQSDATIDTLKQRPSSRVYLQIVPVTVHIGDEAADTYALLDNGSQQTLLREEFFLNFSAEGEQGEMNQGTIKDKDDNVYGVRLNISVSARNGSNKIEIEDVFVQPSGRFNMPSRPRLTDISENDIYTHLDGLNLDGVKPEEISILIGADAGECHIPRDVKRGRKGQQLAFKTPFGWSLFGKSRGDCGCNVQCMATYSSEAMQAAVASFWEEDEKSPTVYINLLRSRADLELHEAVERFWQQEHCGILPQKDVAMSREDIRAMERMEKETKFVNGKYKIPMLWKDTIPKFPDNTAMIQKRFDYLKRKLRGDPDLYGKYKAVIDGYLKVDPPYARKMTSKEIAATSDKT